VVKWAVMKVGLLLSVVVLAGCGRTVSADDCLKIRQNMHDAWVTESKKAASDGPGADKANAAVKAEGEKLVDDWMVECKKELMGRRVDTKEMDCLLRAKTIAQINKCSEP
jgi:hypothetical protein